MILLTNIHINIILHFSIEFGIPFFGSISKEKFCLPGSLFRGLYMVFLLQRRKRMIADPIDIIVITNAEAGLTT